MSTMRALCGGGCSLPWMQIGTLVLRVTAWYIRIAAPAVCIRIRAAAVDMNGNCQGILALDSHGAEGLAPSLYYPYLQLKQRLLHAWCCFEPELARPVVAGGRAELTQEQLASADCLYVVSEHEVKRRADDMDHSDPAVRYEATWQLSARAWAAAKALPSDDTPLSPYEQTVQKNALSAEKRAQRVTERGRRRLTYGEFLQMGRLLFKGGTSHAVEFETYRSSSSSSSSGGGGKKATGAWPMEVLFKLAAARDDRDGDFKLGLEDLLLCLLAMQGPEVMPLARAVVVATGAPALTPVAAGVPAPAAARAARTDALLGQGDAASVAAGSRLQGDGQGREREPGRGGGARSTRTITRPVLPCSPV